MWNHPELQTPHWVSGVIIITAFLHVRPAQYNFYIEQHRTQLKRNRSKSTCVPKTWHMAWHNIEAATLGQLWFVVVAIRGSTAGF